MFFPRKLTLLPTKACRPIGSCVIGDESKLIRRKLNRMPALSARK
jgi:hypothetical protein